MHPKDLSIADYTYDLPGERIAKYQLKNRDESKLLVFKNGSITESFYKNIDAFLPVETLLIFNNTKVVEARLLFQKPNGGVIEIFCLEPGDHNIDIATAMQQKQKVRWKCLIGGAGKWKHGTVLKKMLSIKEEDIVIEAAIVNRFSDCFIVELNWQPVALSFAEVLHIAGVIPLPPYLNRQAEDDDKKSYQTIYAQHDGSVAAPTAGLHFTEQIFEKLAAKGISKAFVTLHVGAGTFKPVKSERMADHEMHAEFTEVTAEAVEQLINYLDKTIVAVGTTSLRTIESLYWIGVKVLKQPDITADKIEIQQWEPYETGDKGITAEEALVSLQKWMKKNELSRLITKTQILIAPGYNLRVATGIITNFHQPQSTLLLLVAAIVGEKWKNIYTYALNNNYRFLSYGDGCLLWKQDLKKGTVV